LAGVLVAVTVAVGCDITNRDRAYQNMILDQKLLLQYQQQGNLDKQIEVLKDLVLCAEYLNLDTSFYKKELNRLESQKEKLAQEGVNPDTAHTPAIVTPTQNLKTSTAPIQISKSTQYPVSQVIKIPPSTPSPEKKGDKKGNVAHSPTPSLPPTGTGAGKGAPKPLATLAQLDRKIGNRRGAVPAVTPLNPNSNPPTPPKLPKISGKFAQIEQFKPQFKLLFPKPVQFSTFKIAGKPYKIVMDFKGGYFKKPVKREWRDGIVIKMAQFKPDTARVVFQSDVPFKLCYQLVADRELVAQPGVCPTEGIVVESKKKGGVEVKVSPSLPPAELK
jgi:hypothetical protein